MKIRYKKSSAAGLENSTGYFDIVRLLKPDFEIRGATWAVAMYLADCFEFLPRLPRSCINAIISDNPYSYSYQGADRGPGFHELAGDDGSFDVLSGLQLALPALYRRAWLYLFGRVDLRTLPVGACGELIWNKGSHGRGGLDDPWAPQHENIQYARYLPSQYDRDEGSGNRAARLRNGSVIEIPRVPRNRQLHKYEKPVPLLTDLIESCTHRGDTVLDYTAGSASVLEAAMRRDRYAIGVEIDKAVFDIACKRLERVGRTLGALEGDWDEPPPTTSGAKLYAVNGNVIHAHFRDHNENQEIDASAEVNEELAPEQPVEAALLPPAADAEAAPPGPDATTEAPADAAPPAEPLQPREIEFSNLTDATNHEAVVIVQGKLARVDAESYNCPSSVTFWFYDKDSRMDMEDSINFDDSSSIFLHAVYSKAISEKVRGEIRQRGFDHRVRHKLTENASVSLAHFSVTSPEANQEFWVVAPGVSMPEGKLSEGQHVRLTGRVKRNPLTNQYCMIARSIEIQPSPIEVYAVTPSAIQHFEKIQSMSTSQIVESTATAIMGSAIALDLVQALLLVLHSVRTFSRKGRQAIKGMLDVLAMGDPGQYKSSVVENMRNALGLGGLVRAESLTQAGLLGGCERVDGRWFLRWGALAKNDGGFVAIDEADKADANLWPHMNSVRSSGVVEINKIVRGQASADVRLLWLANARGHLSDYAPMAHAVRDVFSDASTTRRFDLALAMPSNPDKEQALREQLQAMATAKTVDATFLDALRESVLWAWSLRDEQVVLLDEAEIAIDAASIALAKVYGYGDTLGLVNENTISDKLARVAIAFAALSHSADDAHERLIVKREHVKMAADLFDRAYGRNGLDLATISHAAQQSVVLEESEVARLAGWIDTCDRHETVKGRSTTKLLLREFAQYGSRTKGDLFAATKIPLPSIKRLMKVFARENLITIQRGGGYVRTEKLRKLIAHLVRERVL